MDVYMNIKLQEIFNIHTPLYTDITNIIINYTLDEYIDVISSNTDVVYVVNITQKKCTCPDYVYRHFKYHNYLCKHLKKVL
jgi:hypothetical protein